MKKIFILFIIICLVGCTDKKEINTEEEQKQEIVETKLTNKDYIKNKVDELGEVPIMMYHGIHHKKNSETKKFHY